MAPYTDPFVALSFIDQRVEPALPKVARAVFAERVGLGAGFVSASAGFIGVYSRFFCFAFVYTARRCAELRGHGLNFEEGRWLVELWLLSTRRGSALALYTYGAILGRATMLLLLGECIPYPCGLDITPPSAALPSKQGIPPGTPRTGSCHDQYIIINIEGLECFGYLHTRTSLWT